MAAFTGLGDETTQSIQEWVTQQLDLRMQIAGRAADYINELDTRQKASIAEIAPSCLFREY